MNAKRIPPERKSRLKSLSGKEKARYIWDYYKLPIVICLIFAYIACYTAYGHFTKKETLLYTGLVNISAGEELLKQLSGGFLDSIQESPSRKEVKLYTGLYLTFDKGNPNQEYAYASRMKILATVDGERLDIVLMDKAALDAFSKSGYLYSLPRALQAAPAYLRQKLEPYQAADTAFDLSQSQIIRQAGFQDAVYLGILKNSPRMDMAVKYIAYLYGIQ